ncbi:hypothetical protein [Ornithinibacillus contaminans]|uniref:hypothetical protein n=1 Tax=Ornithinibacillus contaminans TaxID=694055 RepID=UPI00064D8843|nr:hypothetical protein [Ornithinibacillus contaminans]
MEKSIFEESFWVKTLKQEELLKELLRNCDSGSVYFLPSGEWFFTKENYDIHTKDSEEVPIFHLDSECLKSIGNINVDNVIFNILRIFHLYDIYCEGYLRSYGEFLEFVHKQLETKILNILNENKLETLKETYHFKLVEEDYSFNYYISWNSSFDFKILYNNSILGYTDYDGLMKYLIEEESINIKDKRVFFNFCEEIRNLQKYFYKKTKSKYHSRLYTSFHELALIGKEVHFNRKTVWAEMDSPVKIKDIFNHFGKDSAHLKQNDLEKYIDIFHLNPYYDWYEQIAISDVYDVVESVINGEIKEPFSIRKIKCKYTHKYKFNFNSNYIIEWNYQENCYRLKHLENGSYEYFNGIIEFIFFIHDEVRNKEESIKECTLNEVESFIIKVSEQDKSNPEFARLVNYLYEGDIVITSEDLPF